MWFIRPLRRPVEKSPPSIVDYLLRDGASLTLWRISRERCILSRGYKVCNQRAFAYSRWWCTAPLGNPVGNWHGFYTADRITHGHDFSLRIFPRWELIFALKNFFRPSLGIDINFAWGISFGR